MPLTMDEYEYLREEIEQAKGLAGLAETQAGLAAIQREVTEPSIKLESAEALPILLKAMGRALEDAIAVAEGMVEVPLQVRSSLQSKKEAPPRTVSETS